jgi:hypothetical protein
MSYITCTEAGDHCVLDGLGQPLHQAVCGPGLECGVGEEGDFAICVPRKFYFSGIKLQRTEFITAYLGHVIRYMIIIGMIGM